uniref:U1 small nuclear ribonucleoprotein 70 kDa n=1 Tax=Arion vulgaris TaxID=1028688 RepID=A0A0B7AJG6_9EUPU
MTQYLPPNLLALFAARDPLPFLTPADKLPHEKKRVPYSGVAAFLDGFEESKDTPPPTRVETRDERKERKRKERQEQHAYKLEQDLALWEPATNPSATSNPFRTLFIARINFDTSESKLRREFEVYGAVKKICVINDRNSGKPRGYAFIEYEHERDMHSAYKHADGHKIDGRRVLVDVERGRTVEGWRPRRLGGGLGGTRKGGPEENTRFSGRDEFSAVANERGGGGGGFRPPPEDERGIRRREQRSPSPPRERRRRSRSIEKRPERPPRRSRSRERPPRRSRSRERKRSREPRNERGDADVIVPEDEENNVSRRDKKRSRRSRSRDRGDRRRSRSRDRKRSKRSRSKERKIKIKEEELNAGQWVVGDEDGQNGNPEFSNQDFEESIRVKEEKADAYAGYGGPETNMNRGDNNEEFEDGEEGH